MYIFANDLENLFDALSDVVFFVKDKNSRYTHANITLIHRLGLSDRADIVGRRAEDLFPIELGKSYTLQDEQVLSGETISDQLELHLRSNNATGWCLTSKRPIIERGQILGLIGISRDLGRPDERHPTYSRLQNMLNFMHEHFSEPIRIDALAHQAGLSVAQLERHCARVFKLTPRQLLAKVRIEAAMHLFKMNDNISEVGLACGYTDQSAFTRQFKAVVGLTPGQYRAFGLGQKVTHQLSVASVMYQRIPKQG